MQNLQECQTDDPSWWSMQIKIANDRYQEQGRVVSVLQIINEIVIYPKVLPFEALLFLDEILCWWRSERWEYVFLILPIFGSVTTGDNGNYGYFRKGKQLSLLFIPQFVIKVCLQ